MMMAKPGDLEWKFVRYSDPTKALVASDWEIMKNVKLPEAEVEGKLRRSIRKSFYSRRAKRQKKKKLLVEWQRNASNG